MLLKLADGDIAGVFSIDGYIDVQKLRPEEIIDLILKRYYSIS
jgi:hypothetical protein